MKTIILGRQMNVWNDFKLLIENKLEKLDKYFAEEAEATVTLSKKRNLRNIEVTIVTGGTIFRSEVAKEDFRCALDEALETIERQIRKNKTRLAKRLRETIPDEGFFAVEDEDPETVVRTKEIPLKPMSVEEAILQMNLLGHSFFVFRDDADPAHRICVVYARRDGDYGLLVPQE